MFLQESVAPQQLQLQVQEAVQEMLQQTLPF